LKVAWEYHTGDASISDYLQILCNPVEINAVFYETSPKLKLFALDAAMGKQK
jgi:quinoprotein glucose dehydrogenase